MFECFRDFFPVRFFFLCIPTRSFSVLVNLIKIYCLLQFFYITNNSSYVKNWQKKYELSYLFYPVTIWILETAEHFMPNYLHCWNKHWWTPAFISFPIPFLIQFTSCHWQLKGNHLSIFFQNNSLKMCKNSYVSLFFFTKSTNSIMINAQLASHN